MACVELPAFPLQLLLKRRPGWAGRPVAVVERDRAQGVILQVNDEARAAGVRIGMRYSTGLSLAHTLHAGEVSPADVERGVTALAERLLRFSPGVEPSRDEPGSFWLNASGLSRLHASLARWGRDIVTSLGACGFRAVVAIGFTRFGTRAIARTLVSGRPVAVLRDLAGERAWAGRVPLDRLGIAPALRDRLHDLGVHSVGAFLDLPCEGIRRRFGPEAQRLHRLAAGDLWTPLQPQRLLEPLVAHCDLDDPETDAVRLLFSLKRLLDRMLAMLAARHEALAELTLHLRLDRAGTQTARIRPAAPTLDVVQLMNLVRLRLETMALEAGVSAVGVSGRSIRVAAVQPGLFAERPRRDRAAAERALARVRAEFGDETVVRARLVEAHLPEACFAWEPTGTVPAPAPHEVACPPMVRRIHARASALALHPEPGGRLEHGGETGYGCELTGPYLVSGGWWRAAVHREYYFARMREGDMLWLYYDRRRRRWRAQGRVE